MLTFGKTLPGAAAVSRVRPRVSPLKNRAKLPIIRVTKSTGDATKSFASRNLRSKGRSGSTIAVSSRNVMINDAVFIGAHDPWNASRYGKTMLLSYLPRCQKVVSIENGLRNVSILA